MGEKIHVSPLAQISSGRVKNLVCRIFAKTLTSSQDESREIIVIMRRLLEGQSILNFTFLLNRGHVLLGKDNRHSFSHPGQSGWYPWVECDTRGFFPH